MPIKRLQRQTAAFPRIGKLRKGGEKPNDRQPGKDLDYFRFDSDDPEAAQRFTASYGEQPRQINVYLPYESADENFQTWQEAYTAGAMQHRCDGETCVIWLQKDGTYSQEPVPCPGGCKEVGRLNVIIPELARLAYVTVETHSINDILQITDNLNAALALRGSLTGIPFVLSRRPQEISTPGKDGKRARYTKWLLFLEPHPDWVRVQLAAMRHNALTFAAGGLALPEYRQLTDGGAVDTGTGEIVDVEPTVDDEADFYPPEPPPEPTPKPPPANGATHDQPAEYPASWRTPPDAQLWALHNGSCANEHEARNSWVNSVKACGGFDPKKNASQVFSHFYAKHQARQQSAEPEAPPEAEAEPAF